MAITTKEISTKLKKDITNKIKPILSELRKTGISDKRLGEVINQHFKVKLRHEYQRLSDFESIRNVLSTVFQNISQRGADSQAEILFYHTLQEQGISFAFHHEIGPYIADYLIDEDLVVELDGPQHKYSQAKDKTRDRYMERLGYRVLRIPLKYFVIDKNAVMMAIQDAREG